SCCARDRSGRTARAAASARKRLDALREGRWWQALDYSLVRCRRQSVGEGTIERYRHRQNSELYLRDSTYRGAGRLRPDRAKCTFIYAPASQLSHPHLSLLSGAGLRKIAMSDPP